MRSFTRLREGLTCYIIENYGSGLNKTAISICQRCKLPYGSHDDVMQNFFEKVHRNWRQIFLILFKSKNPKYLFTMVKMEVLQMVRKRKRRKERERLYTQISSPNPNKEDFSDGLKFSWKWGQEILRSILSEREFEILILYYSGYKYKEIADMMGLKKGTIGAIISRAKTKLKNKGGIKLSETA